MSEETTISFVLKGKVNGVSLTPETIGLSQFNEFNRQVEEFIAGSQHLKLEGARIDISEGSYKIGILLSSLLFSALEPDLELLHRQDSLGEIDPKRQEIITKWQSRSKQSDDWQYQIVPQKGNFSKITISNKSDFHVGKIVPWIAVEKQLLGQIVDMGGIQKANVHLRLIETGKTVILNSSQSYLQNQEENRLYHKVLVHVKAEQHHKTGELRNIKLIRFVDYSPNYDESALDEFSIKGSSAWAEVTDSAAWVRKLRGGT